MRKLIITSLLAACLTVATLMGLIGPVFAVSDADTNHQAVKANSQYTLDKPLLGNPALLGIYDPQTNLLLQQETKSNEYINILSKAFNHICYVKNLEMDPPAVVKLSVGRDGHLLDTALIRASQNPKDDQKLLHALERHAPFPPIPEILNRDSFEIAFYGCTPAKIRMSRPPLDPNQFSTYVTEIQNRIRKAWKPSLYSQVAPKNYSITTRFLLDREGNLLHRSVLYSSNANKVYEELALQTIDASAPFRPFPAGTSEEIVKVEFTFDYNVYYGKKSK